MSLESQLSIITRPPLTLTSVWPTEYQESQPSLVKTPQFLTQRNLPIPAYRLALDQLTNLPHVGPGIQVEATFYRSQK
jgi:hypothetical protein